MQHSHDYQECTILYVDDEEKSLKYFRRAFRDKFKILSAASAADGYRLLKEHRDEIALLISDQRMPGEKGVEFLKRARQLHPTAIRILTTAYTDFDAAVEAVNSAAVFRYVTKPWDISELETILKTACELFIEQQERERGELSSSSGAASGAEAASGDLLTLEQVAHYLSVNRFTVYRLVLQKKIPAFKVGNQWRFKQEMVDAWLLAKSNISRKPLR